METVTVSASSKVESKIYIGGGISAGLIKSLTKNKKTLLLADQNVYNLYREFIKQNLNFPCFVLKSGENSKNFNNLSKILSFLCENNALRNSVLVVLGGGVTGDIGGLAASLYMRGIEVIQIPTTLLSQVDSSVGGKTAVNFAGAKNVVGSFYQPSNVICDTDFLDTLKKRDINSGLGEVIKTAGLNKELYQELTKNLCRLSEAEYIKSLVAPCVRHKADVVSRDEKETTGLRKTLNLGHTTGHALELFYKKKSHGEYVLLGLLLEMYIAKRLGVIDGGFASGYEKIIKKVVKPRFYDNLDEALKKALLDKKNTKGNTVSLIVPCGGACREIDLSFDEYLKLAHEYNNWLKEGRL